VIQPSPVALHVIKHTTVMSGGAGALYFDIDRVADTSTDLPHMIPSPAFFAEARELLLSSNISDISFPLLPLPTFRMSSCF
jgi:hypothetical protein